MNKLTTVTIVAVATLVLTGCCRSSPRWFGHGDVCGPTGTTTLYDGSEYTGPSLMAPSLVPGRSYEIPLPGPVVGP